VSVGVLLGEMDDLIEFLIRRVELAIARASEKAIVAVAHLGDLKPPRHSLSPVMAKEVQHPLRVGAFEPFSFGKPWRWRAIGVERHQFG
jgi:hypothetical protein